MSIKICFTHSCSGEVMLAVVFEESMGFLEFKMYGLNPICLIVISMYLLLVLTLILLL